MSLKIPVPVDNFQIVWLLIGMSFGRNFGKKLDYEIQQANWFKGLPPEIQGLIKRILDFTHHWWIGAIIWLYAPLITAWWFWPSLELEIMWFGVGLFLDDIRDFNHVKNRYNRLTTETTIK